MTIEVGDPLPEATFRTMTADGPKPVTTAEFFAGRTVVLFAVPGAFTPTCSRAHLPGFVADYATIRAKGVDAVAVTSTNDAFVLAAWLKEAGAQDTIAILADGNAEFAEATGLVMDGTAFGLGKRSRRYSMLVRDGRIETLNVEDGPGKAELSGAACMLGQL